MRQKSGPPETAEQHIKSIRRHDVGGRPCKDGQAHAMKFVRGTVAASRIQADIGSGAVGEANGLIASKRRITRRVVRGEAF